MKETLSILSAILSIAGLLWYNKEIRNKNSTPNIVVLAIWNVTAIINVITYVIIVQDMFKALLPFTGAVLNIVLFVNTLRSKKFLLLKRDIWIIAISMIIMGVIILIMNTKDIHIIMQVITTIPYIPLIIGIIDGKGKEPLNVWFLIFISTVFGLGAVLVEYSDYWSLIHPLRSIALQIITMICIKFRIEIITLIGKFRKAPLGGAFCYTKIPIHTKNRSLPTAIFYN